MQISSFYSKKRIITVFIILILLLIYILVSYAFLASKKVPVFIKPVENIERGSILDRNGKSLAVQTNFYHLCASPAAISDKEKTANILAKPLEYTPEHLLSLLDSTASFVYIKKKMDQTEYNEVSKIIEKNKIYGFRFEKVQGRTYPENALASQVIGFMGNDGTGLSGIEYTYQQILSPQYKEGHDNRGKDIYLTIDANLQYKLEKIAQEAKEKTKAESIMLIASQAKTGEILSYISLPSANLNTYPQSAIEEKIDLPAVTAYEPGSVFKLFTVASVVDSGKAEPNEKFFCNGIYEIKSKSEEGTKITCLARHGPLTPQEALQYSCNDVLAQMSERIETEEFLKRIHMFGFGSRTGIELPGETKGLVKNTSSKLWSGRSKPTIAIGQEISVSAIQMVQAATAFTNDGIPIKPTLISHIDDKNGKVYYKHDIQYLSPVISAQTASYILNCMENTALKGTGTKALLPDISIGVKTGTAQMLDTSTGTYSKTDFVSNCLSVFPAENPQIILYIVITKAQGENYAGRIVAPVIGEAANVIIDHLGMTRANAQSFYHGKKKEIVPQQTIKIKNTVPNFIGLSKSQIIPLLNNPDINIKIEGYGNVVEQYPDAGTPIIQGMSIELILQ